MDIKEIQQLYKKYYTVNKEEKHHILNEIVDKLDNSEYLSFCNFDTELRKKISDELFNRRLNVILQKNLEEILLSMTLDVLFMEFDLLDDYNFIDKDKINVLKSKLSSEIFEDLFHISCKIRKFKNADDLIKKCPDKYSYSFFEKNNTNKIKFNEKADKTRCVSIPVSFKNENGEEVDFDLNKDSGLNNLILQQLELFFVISRYSYYDNETKSVIVEISKEYDDYLNYAKGQVSDGIGENIECSVIPHNGEYYGIKLGVPVNYENNFALKI